MAQADSRRATGFNEAASDRGGEPWRSQGSVERRGQASTRPPLIEAENRAQVRAHLRLPSTFGFNEAAPERGGEPGARSASHSTCEVTRFNEAASDRGGERANSGQPLGTAT